MWTLAERNDGIPLTIAAIRERPKPISAKKDSYLKKVLKWGSKRFHDYYRNLKYGKNEYDD